MGRSTRGRPKAPKSDENKVDTNNGKPAKDSKRPRAEKDENASVGRKMPKRAAACSDFKERSTHLSEKSSLVETKKEVIVEDEPVALALTSGLDDSRPNRRLKDFTFHDVDGSPQPVEMLEFNDLYISGVIMPLDDSDQNVKEKAVRCDGFGRIESWDISGYEEGSPVVWVSTDSADYECMKPSSKYRKVYNFFFDKASVCVEVYKKLSRTHGGNPDLSLEELVAGVVRSMSGNKNFSRGAAIKEFLFSQGDLIYNQLVGLDVTSKKNDQVFTDLPVLVALRDEKKQGGFGPLEALASGRASNGSLKIGGETATLSTQTVEDEDMKLARLLQEEENWASFKQKDRRIPPPSSKVYIKINEDEIANDYPVPSFYKTCVEETDEFIIIEDVGSGELPENVLHDWTLYNSDARLISLELLPMMPCADVDVTIFGSGAMSDGSGFCMDVDSCLSSSGSQTDTGLPIYLSAIKEWKIEFGGSLVYISIRTDMSWYRLGKPSKQYAPWYEPVLKTAKLGISIITLLTEQSRVSRLSFAEVIKRVSEFGREHPAFISSNLAVVERYVVVHGQIILQQFAEFPDKNIGKCAFVTGLRNQMELRHHTKLQVNKKKVLMDKGVNLNPREAVAFSSSTRNAMPATTTRLINRIWGEYYSNYLPEDQQIVESVDVKVDEVEEEQEENGEEDVEEGEDQKMEVDERTMGSQSDEKPPESPCSYKDTRWKGESLGKSSSGVVLYKNATVHGYSVSVGDFVLLTRSDPDQLPCIYLVEYMFENSDASKMAHGQLVLRGFQTVLGNAGNERELFLTNDCCDFELDDIKHTISVEIRSIPWGYEHRRTNMQKDKIDRERAADRKSKGLSTEYYCKSLYWPERGAFFSLPKDKMGLGSGVCHSCRTKEIRKEKEGFTLNLPGGGFTFKGTDYYTHDFVYVAPSHFAADTKENGTFKGGRNVGLRPFVIGQLLDIEVSNTSKQPSPGCSMVKIRRFFRPEDISTDKAYCSDIREVYYSEETLTIPILAIEGKCEVNKKHDLPLLDSPSIVDHVFFCEHMYDPDKGTIKKLPAHIKIRSSKGSDVACRKNKGKCKEGEDDSLDLSEKSETKCKSRLATLDIFAGCGGLSEGLEQAGASLTKWAIEYEEPAGEAFRLNNPEALVFVNNCNVILRAVMAACGDSDDCISTKEASELAEKLDEEQINSLPRPGQVEFINGGPPCQGFSGMNRFNQGAWSKVQCEMILAFLSFADYFRPKFFLLENVRNFISFNKGQTFRLTLASLLEMGYQVRFGILEAGAFGISQSRKRAFIWAASPEETLPEWPEPMHVFASPELKVTLSGKSHYAAARSTANGAPFRAITVRDTIGDLPAVEDGASVATMDFKNEPASLYQKVIRKDSTVLTDHITKAMTELNLIRCKRIPKRPGCDWRDLPEEKVRLSNGQVVELIPWCLPNTADRHNQWKGLFGRLDWEGNFPTSITDPQPMGKVGMCFHPEQDRIVTVRECARSQGFPDSYKFSGNIQHRYRQIGNAVPPPLAYALGRKLKEAVEGNSSK